MEDRVKLCGEGAPGKGEHGGSECEACPRGTYRGDEESTQALPQGWSTSSQVRGGPPVAQGPLGGTVLYCSDRVAQ